MKFENAKKSRDTATLRQEFSGFKCSEENQLKQDNLLFSGFTFFSLKLVWNDWGHFFVSIIFFLVKLCVSFQCWGAGRRGGGRSAIRSPRSSPPPSRTSQNGTRSLLQIVSLLICEKKIFFKTSVIFSQRKLKRKLPTCVSKFTNFLENIFLDLAKAKATWWTLKIVKNSKTDPFY